MPAFSVLPSSLPRALLAAFLLAGAAFPATVLLSSPAMAEDGGDGSGGGAGSGNDCGGASSGHSGDCGCDSSTSSDSGYGGGGDGGGDGGSWTWTDDPTPSPTSWTPIFGTTRFDLPGCGPAMGQAFGIGTRGDSTYTPGWGSCRR